MKKGQNENKDEFDQEQNSIILLSKISSLRIHIHIMLVYPPYAVEI